LTTLHFKTTFINSTDRDIYRSIGVVRNERGASSILLWYSYLNIPALPRGATSEMFSAH
jgi:hypothetical protein